MFHELDEEKPKRKRRSAAEVIDLPRLYVIRSQKHAHRSPVYFTDPASSASEARAKHVGAVVALMGTHETLVQAKARLGWE